MNRKGFTLIEVLIAIVLLSLAIVSLGQFMGKYQRATANATLLSTMTTIGKERLELVRGDVRYTTLTSRYGTGTGADTVGFPGFATIRRITIVNRDQTGAPPRDRTTVTVRVFSNNNLIRDTVNLTAVIARP
mgnify:CR=1 FL=1